MIIGGVSDARCRLNKFTSDSYLSAKVIPGSVLIDALDSKWCSMHSDLWLGTGIRTASGHSHHPGLVLGVEGGGRGWSGR